MKQVRTVRCRCGRAVLAELINTNVPRTIPVYIILCPTCDWTPT